MMDYKTLVAASLMSLTLSSHAFAQCVDCAMYPNRDHLNGGETPASKMGLDQPRGATPSNAANNANAEVRGHDLQRSGHSSGPDSNRSKKHLSSPDSLPR